MKNDDIIAHVERWLDQIVIELDLCPFARKERVSQRIRFAVSEATREEGLLEALSQELNRLHATPEIETTLLIHPYVLQSFTHYNQFLNVADALLASLGFAGRFQIASFHPDYQFVDTQPDDAENYTNRSPYPLLHILREDSVERAVDQHPDIDAVPTANIDKLRSLGAPYLSSLLQSLARSDRL